jgi:hypothetical protein
MKAALSPPRSDPAKSQDFLPKPPDGPRRMLTLKAFGERIAARDPDRQTTEIHFRIVLINRFSALGTAEIVRVT